MTLVESEVVEGLCFGQASQDDVESRDGVLVTARVQVARSPLDACLSCGSDGGDELNGFLGILMCGFFRKSV